MEGVATIGQIKGALTVGERSFTFDHALTTEDFSMATSEIKDFIGDAGARISVSLGMSDKNYGTGFDAHVSVTLTCDQDADVIGFAHEAASEIVAEKILEVMDVARELWSEYEPQT
jgi:hypothetical protein